MGKHTGGEWSYVDDNGENPRIVSTAIDPGTGKPCVLVDLTCAMRAVGDDAFGEARANGRVMAASSVMLAALKAILEWGREHTSPLDANSPHALLVSAAAAVAAAEARK